MRSSVKKTVIFGTKMLQPGILANHLIFARRVILVSSDGAPSLNANPDHRAVPLFTSKEPSDGKPFPYELM